MDPSQRTSPTVTYRIQSIPSWETIPEFGRPTTESSRFISIGLRHCIHPPSDTHCYPLVNSMTNAISSPLGTTNALTDGKRNIVVRGTKNGRLFQVDNDSVALLRSHELAPATPHGRSGAHELAPGAHHGQSGAHVLAPGAHHGRSGAHILAPGAPHGQSGAHDLAPAAQPGRSSPQKRLSLQDSQLWHRRLAHPTTQLWNL